MSDSDVDLLPRTFQNESTTVSASGHNINASILTDLSFRKVMTSTMNTSPNFERQKYLEQSYDQKSMYDRWDTSPPPSSTPLHSASNLRPRNYQHMYHPHDSNATVSATDIALAFKNMNFNNYDLKVIKYAYNQFIKRRICKKIEKRRNLRLFMKGQRRKSGYDSGELGSVSSISSDNCRSTCTSHTSIYRHYMSNCRTTETENKMKEANLNKDCTEHFRENAFKNMLGVAPKNTTVHMQNRDQNELPATQKDIFINGFILPSQRFILSVAPVTIPKEENRIQYAAPDTNFGTNATKSDTYSDEEIFNEYSRKQMRYKNKETNAKINVADEKTLASTKNSPKIKKKSPIKNVSPNCKKSLTKNNLPSKRKSPSKEKSECRILVKKLSNSKLPVVPEPEKIKVISTEEIPDKNKRKLFECVKLFWDTDFESDFECGHSEKKKMNSNQGNLTQKVTHIQSNKTLDGTQSKFVWNSSSTKLVTFNSHIFSRQEEAVNVNKSLTEMTTNKKEPAKSDKTTEKPKKPSKNIVLDSYNETVINANNKPRAPPAKKNENTKKNYILESQIPDYNKLKTASTPPKKSKLKTANNGKTQAKDLFIINKGNRIRALRDMRMENIENSLLDDLRRDDSQMLNTSFTKTVSAMGPNTSASNFTDLSFRNIVSSTMNMSRNFERQKDLKQSYDQTSTYDRWDTSPPPSSTPLHSASNFRPSNYQDMYHPHGMSSQRCMINGRSGSPISMRSMDSNATVSATDIAIAFKNMNFNKYDLKMIKDAYNQFIKRTMCRKIKKRRNLKLFLKGQRRKSGYDSGELGSVSSISSDDCRSTCTSHTSVYRENMSICRTTEADVTDFTRTMKKDSLNKDCTEHLRDNIFKNMLGVAPKITTVHMQNSDQCELPATQKDALTIGFMLPSQRFIQSVGSVPIPKEENRIQNAAPDPNFEANATKSDTYSDEEIFNEHSRKQMKYKNKKTNTKINVADENKLPTTKNSPKNKKKSPIKNVSPNSKKSLTKNNLPNKFSKSPSKKKSESRILVEKTGKEITDKSKGKLYECVKSFWGTDFESECD